jgi:putative SOS response-associated peptidase YedK
MCGRYVTPTEAAMERAMDLRGRDIGRELGRIFANYDTRPTQSVPAIRQHGDTREVVRLDDSGDRELVSLRWGLVPRWAKGKAGAYATFNARIETLRTSPAFRDAWKRGQRCLLPVAGFYEWQAQPPDWQKVVQHYITCTDQPEVFAMAGLWDSSTTEDGEVVESCTVITMPANALMREIHNSKRAGSKRVLLPEADRRMPAILAAADQEAWLRGTADEAWAVLKPYPAELMRAVGVKPSKADRPPELL